MYQLRRRSPRRRRLRGYEISNWARPGHESRHNLGVLAGPAWEAVGPGAHAFDGVTRRWNAARLDGYLAALAPADGRRRACRRAARSRSTTATAAPGGRDPRAADARRVPLTAAHARRSAAPRWALERGLLERTPATRRPDAAGRLLSNEVFARLV